MYEHNIFMHVLRNDNTISRFIIFCHNYRNKRNFFISILCFTRLLVRTTVTKKKDIFLYIFNGEVVATCREISLWTK